MDGREYLRYKPFPIHVALVRASAADEDGNISFEHEAANLDAQSLALAARNSGGRVIVQVKRAPAARRTQGARGAHSVRLGRCDCGGPRPAQQLRHPVRSRLQRRADRRRARLRGRRPCGRAGRGQRGFSERQAVARRAAVELFNTGKARPVVNYGVGVPDAVAKLMAARGEQHRIYQTIEHGTYGGTADGWRAVRLCAQRQRHAGRTHAV
jgi:propionate CoA-transferase